MKNIKIKSKYVKLLADLHTPVSLYLKLRDQFANAILLESSDYHGNENSFSYICFQPIGEIKLKDGFLDLKIEGIQESRTKSEDFVNEFINFINSFEYHDPGTPVISNGFFGFISYGGVELFESINLVKSSELNGVPTVYYATYRFLIAFDHFKNEIYIFEHQIEGVEKPSQLNQVISIIQGRNIPQYGFEIVENEISNLSNQQFKDNVSKGISHCLRGDVFQVVLSRRYKVGFWGDEFNVYRALRSLNPSPYLFYFDQGNYKLFGSSPEAQLVIGNGKANIFPIAGTFKRTGNDQRDQELALQLQNDSKENAEHIMLVDLARNDLSKNTKKVNVESFMEVQFYSHVIHLVSKVTGVLNGQHPVQLIGDTFPAGTLSGAPKYRAMEIINEIEPTARDFYGGAIGYLGFNGDFNHAIVIRSFFSQENVLFYQAGAGIVAKSDPEKELDEVNNKLGALRRALKEAENMS